MLAIVSFAGVSLLGVLFFVVISVLLYARPFFEGYPTKSAFLVLLPVFILGTELVRETFLFFPAVIFFSVIFSLILGIKEYLFIKRSRLYYVSSLSLFYLMFLFFFFADKSDYFIFKYGAVIFASYLLFREWLALISTFQFPRRERVAALIGAFLIAQLLWATALLPIGFLNSANLMLLFTFVIAELLVNYFLGTINKNFLIQHAVFFGILFAIIYWTSSWTLKY